MTTATQPRLSVLAVAKESQCWCADGVVVHDFDVICWWHCQLCLHPSPYVDYPFISTMDYQQ